MTLVLHHASKVNRKQSQRPLPFFAAKDGGPSWDEARLSEQPQQSQQSKQHQHGHLSIPATRRQSTHVIIFTPHTKECTHTEHQTVYITSLKTSLCWPKFSVLFFDDLICSLAMERVCSFQEPPLTPLEAEDMHTQYRSQ